MPKQSFLLVSLQEDKAKKLAQVVSNESCRKILDFLTQKDASETEIAEKLGLPMSTVHYNLKQLSDAGLISVEEFHYSKKGKEVNHYKLANKYIIIAPKSTFGLKERLKRILPAALIVAGAGFVLELVSRLNVFQITENAPAMAQEAAIAAPSFGKDIAAKQTSATLNMNLVTNTAYLWFLGGALSIALLYLLTEYLTFKKRH